MLWCHRFSVVSIRVCVVSDPLPAPLLSSFLHSLFPLSTRLSLVPLQPHPLQSAHHKQRSRPTRTRRRRTPSKYDRIRSIVSTRRSSVERKLSSNRIDLHLPLLLSHRPSRIPILSLRRLAHLIINAQQLPPLLLQPQHRHPNRSHSRRSSLNTNSRSTIRSTRTLIVAAVAVVVGSSSQVSASGRMTTMSRRSRIRWRSTLHRPTHHHRHRRHQLTQQMNLARSETRTNSTSSMVLLVVSPRSLQAKGRMVLGSAMAISADRSVIRIAMAPRLLSMARPLRRVRLAHPRLCCPNRVVRRSHTVPTSIPPTPPPPPHPHRPHPLTQHRRRRRRSTSRIQHPSQSTRRRSRTHNRRRIQHSQRGRH